MQSANVNVKAVYPPKPGGKMGSIVTVEGDRFFGLPNVLKQVPSGQVVRVSFDEEQWRDGPVKVVKSVVVNPPTNGNAKPYQPPSKAPQDQFMIFVTGIVGRAMGSGQFGITDLLPLTMAAAEAYDAVTGKPVQRDEQLDDSIPY